MISPKVHFSDRLGRFLSPVMRRVRYDTARLR
jgi:hypothetical protein